MGGYPPKKDDRKEEDDDDDDRNLLFPIGKLIYQKRRRLQVFLILSDILNS